MISRLHVPQEQMCNLLFLFWLFIDLRPLFLWSIENIVVLLQCFHPVNQNMENQKKHPSNIDVAVLMLFFPDFVTQKTRIL